MMKKEFCCNIIIKTFLTIIKICVDKEVVQIMIINNEISQAVASLP